MCWHLANRLPFVSIDVVDEHADHVPCCYAFLTTRIVSRDYDVIIWEWSVNLLESAYCAVSSRIVCQPSAAIQLRYKNMSTLKEGSMYKRGKLNTDWKLRTFVLTSKQLAYFKGGVREHFNKHTSTLLFINSIINYITSINSVDTYN